MNFRTPHSLPNSAVFSSVLFLLALLAISAAATSNLLSLSSKYGKSIPIPLVRHTPFLPKAILDPNLDEPFPLGGNIDKIGLYYAFVELGTPPMQFAFQLDTGSSDLLVYSTNCSRTCKFFYVLLLRHLECNKHHKHAPIYNVSASSTSTSLPCKNFSSADITCYSCYDGNVSGNHACPSNRK